MPLSEPEAGALLQAQKNKIYPVFNVIKRITPKKKGYDIELAKIATLLDDQTPKM